MLATQCMHSLKLHALVQSQGVTHAAINFGLAALAISSCAGVEDHFQFDDSQFYIHSPPPLPPHPLYIR